MIVILYSIKWISAAFTKSYYIHYMNYLHLRHILGLLILMALSHLMSSSFIQWLRLELRRTFSCSQCRFINTRYVRLNNFMFLKFSQAWLFHGDCRSRFNQYCFISLLPYLAFCCEQWCSSGGIACASFTFMSGLDPEI